MLPVAGAILIGILIYAAIPTILGIIILCVLSALASWIGIKIFKTVQIVGPIDFMTAVHATPELDKKVQNQTAIQNRNNQSNSIKTKFT